ncbi:MAG: hypothetical protein D6689_03665, partial [Deltaproteobacteria bacterium]
MGLFLHPMALAAYAPTLFVAIYLLALWDARRDGSDGAGDRQIGLKAAVHVFALIGVFTAAGGLQEMLGYLLGKFKGDVSSAQIKAGIGHLLAGGGVFVLVYLFLLPRTNWRERDKVTRLAVGAAVVVLGILAIVSFVEFLGQILSGAEWVLSAQMLAGSVAFGGVAYVALDRLGQMSGWAGRPSAPAGFPPAGGYDPNAQPQQPGVPPAGGGFPPAGGGYPPAGGGYPPAGGGYPPAGGGYPP